MPTGCVLLQPCGAQKKTAGSYSNGFSKWSDQWSAVFRDELVFPYRRANTRFRASGNVARNSSLVIPAPVNAEPTRSHNRSNRPRFRKTTNPSPIRKTSTRVPIPIPKSSRNRFGTVICPLSPSFVVTRNSKDLDCVGIAEPHVGITYSAKAETVSQKSPPRSPQSIFRSFHLLSFRNLV